MEAALSFLRGIYASAMFSIALAFAQVDSRMYVREPVAIVQKIDRTPRLMRKKLTVRRYRKYA
ncbi:MAG: hypothetical protein JNL32_01785 [Candidatus Kapabacteria bacterium]|nr:hypothetical protein [Candidatus Kapabacteria bacterium]